MDGELLGSMMERVGLAPRPVILEPADTNIPVPVALQMKQQRLSLRLYGEHSAIDKMLDADNVRFFLLPASIYESIYSGQRLGSPLEDIYREFKKEDVGGNYLAKGVDHSITLPDGRYIFIIKDVRKPQSQDRRDVPDDFRLAIDTTSAQIEPIYIERTGALQTTSDYGVDLHRMTQHGSLCANNLDNLPRVGQNRLLLVDEKQIPGLSMNLLAKADGNGGNYFFQLTREIVTDKRTFPLASTYTPTAIVVTNPGEKYRRVVRFPNKHARNLVLDPVGLSLDPKDPVNHPRQFQPGDVLSIQVAPDTEYARDLAIFELVLNERGALSFVFKDGVDPGKVEFSAAKREVIARTIYKAGTEYREKCKAEEERKKRETNLPITQQVVKAVIASGSIVSKIR